MVGDKWEFFRIINKIRKEHYDLALSFSQIGSYFTRFCAATYRGDFFSVNNENNQPVVEKCLKVLGAIGLNTVKIETEFWFSDEDRRAVNLFLKDSGYDQQAPLIAIHCGGHYFTRKRWPTKNFIELIRILKLKTAVQVVLVGGNEDIENSLIIRSAVPGVISAAGILKLSQSAALLKRCRLLIGNDSGPLHLGAAVQVPTLGLFGPTDPLQFYPYNPPVHKFIYKSLSCSPCYKFGGKIWQYIPRCSKAYCMEQITAEEVFRLAEREIFCPQRSNN